MLAEHEERVVRGVVSEIDQIDEPVTGSLIEMNESAESDAERLTRYEDVIGAKYAPFACCCSDEIPAQPDPDNVIAMVDRIEPTKVIKLACIGCGMNLGFVEAQLEARRV